MKLTTLQGFKISLKHRLGIIKEYIYISSFPVRINHAPAQRAVWKQWGHWSVSTYRLLTNFYSSEIVYSSCRTGNSNQSC